MVTDLLGFHLGVRSLCVLQGVGHVLDILSVRVWSSVLVNHNLPHGIVQLMLCRSKSTQNLGFSLLADS